MPPELPQNEARLAAAFEKWRHGPFIRDSQPAHLTAALLTALGFCQAIKTASKPSSDADDYFTSQDGLRNHNRNVKTALLEYNVIREDANRADLPYGFGAFGRRSNRRRAWAQPLLTVLDENHVLDANRKTRERIIGEFFQEPMAKELRTMVEARPVWKLRPDLTLDVNVERMLAEARNRNAHGHVAQVLVAAKLIIRFELARDFFSTRELSGSSADRQRSGDDRAGDLQVGDFVYEVAISRPNDEHLAKARDRWQSGGFVLVVPDECIKQWKQSLRSTHVDDLVADENKLDTRVRVRGIVQFVSQNIDECAGERVVDHPDRIREFFTLYNELMRNENLRVSLKA